MEELMNHGGTEVTEKTVKERPILFSGPMVRAILDGRKTQTRRIINPQPFEVSSVECGMYTPTRIDRHGEMYPGADVFGVWSETDEEWGVPCPYGQPGDRLWVRESFYTAERYPGTGPDGMADYLLMFRKPPVGTLMSDKPVVNEDCSGFNTYVGELDPRIDKSFHPSPYARVKPSADGSIDIWQRYAEPVWWDIDQMDVLNYRDAGSDEDERHICPLQLGLIERAVEIWSNPGDVVLSPFAGVGSEGVGALRRGRKFIGIELKPEYWERGCRELKKADSPKSRQRKLVLE